MKTFYVFLLLVGVTWALPQNVGSRGGRSHFSNGPFTVTLDDQDDTFEVISPFADSSQIQPTARGSFHFNTNLGASRNFANSHFSVIRESAEDVASNERQARFGFSSRAEPNTQESFSSELFDDDDDFSLFSNRMSLGRRFHPLGVPKRQDPIAIPQTPSTARINPHTFTNPHIHAPNFARQFIDDSLETEEVDSDERSILRLSPGVRAFKHETKGERLSVASDILNQYNFVDVQGTTNWGYKTNDQFQEHKVHNDGTMQGSFGWTAPEGAEVSIKYIADKGGYRVISSHGAFQKNSADVQQARENHFQEHAKAVSRLEQEISDKSAPASGTSGVTIPESTQEGIVSSPDGFVVIQDEDNFPLISPQQPSQTSSGVPLPNFEQSSIQGSIRDETSNVQPDSASMGIPLPTANIDQTGLNAGAPVSSGVPLPTDLPEGPEFINSKQSPALRSGSADSPGVPLPVGNIDQTGGNAGAHVSSGVPLPTDVPEGPEFVNSKQSPALRSGSADSPGVPLPGANIDQTGGNAGAPVSSGVPLPTNLPEGPEFINSKQAPALRSGSFGTQSGVPLPGVGTHQSSGIGSNIGVPLPTVRGTAAESPQGRSDPSSNTIIAGIPLPSSSVSSLGGTSQNEIGVPLSSLSPSEQPSSRAEPIIETVPSVSLSGVPLPTVPSSENILRSGDFPSSSMPSSSSGVPIPILPLAEPTSGRTPSEAPVSAVGVPLPGPSSKPELSIAKPLTPTISSRGVPLPSPSTDQVLNNVQPQTPTIPSPSSVGVPLSSLPSSESALERSEPFTPTSLSSGVPLPSEFSKPTLKNAESGASTLPSSTSQGVALPVLPSSEAALNDPESLTPTNPSVASPGIPLPANLATKDGNFRSSDIPSSSSGVQIPNLTLRTTSTTNEHSMATVGVPLSAAGAELPLQNNEQEVGGSSLSSGVPLPESKQPATSGTVDSISGTTKFGVQLPSLNEINGENSPRTEVDLGEPAPNGLPTPLVNEVGVALPSGNSVIDNQVLSEPFDNHRQSDPQSVGVSLPVLGDTASNNPQKQGRGETETSPAIQNVVDTSVPSGVRLPTQSIISQSSATRTGVPLPAETHTSIGRSEAEAISPAQIVPDTLDANIGIPLSIKSESALTEQPSIASVPSTPSVGVPLPKFNEPVAPQLANPSVEITPSFFPAVTGGVSLPSTADSSFINEGVSLTDLPENRATQTSITKGSNRIGVPLPSLPTESSTGISSPRKPASRLPTLTPQRFNRPTSSSSFGVALPTLAASKTPEEVSVVTRQGNIETGIPIPLLSSRDQGRNAAQTPSVSGGVPLPFGATSADNTPRFARSFDQLLTLSRRQSRQSSSSAGRALPSSVRS